MKKSGFIRAVKHWVDTAVVGLNLCPFAKRELVRNRVRFVSSKATTEAELLADIEGELELLSRNDDIETTLLIHPEVLTDFYDYNQFLNYTDGLLEQLNLEGIFQIASFHPDYQFGGTEAEDVENYTNRSPYPMLHLIREKSLQEAIANYPDSDRIPDRNIKLLKSMGLHEMKALLQACYDAEEKK